MASLIWFQYYSWLPFFKVTFTVNYWSRKPTSRRCRDLLRDPDLQPKNPIWGLLTPERQFRLSFKTKPVSFSFVYVGYLRRTCDKSNLKGMSGQCNTSMCVWLTDLYSNQHQIALLYLGHLHSRVHILCFLIQEKEAGWLNLTHRFFLSHDFFFFFLFTTHTASSAWWCQC